MPFRNRRAWLFAALPVLGTLLLIARFPLSAEESSPEKPVAKPAQENEPPRKELKLPGLEINVPKRYVDVDCTVCLDQGFLELIACIKESKEHESIVAIDAKPMHIHAALLLLGAVPGNPMMHKPIEDQPGRWLHIPPRGDRVDVFLVFKDKQGKQVERPISDFVVRNDDRTEELFGTDSVKQEDEKFPHTFLFAGSIIRDDVPAESKYLCDMSGDVISIATFGDEVLCLPGEHAQDNGSLMWEVDGTHLPKVGTKVKLRLRPQAKPGPKTEKEPSKENQDKP
jgi:hypothetical protein